MLRGTPSIRTCDASRISPIVVVKTSPEKRNVQIGSAKRKLGWINKKQNAIIEILLQKWCVNIYYKVFDNDGRNKNSYTLDEVAYDVDQGGPYVHVTRIMSVVVTVPMSGISIHMRMAWPMWVAMPPTADSVRVTMVNQAKLIT